MLGTMNIPIRPPKAPPKWPLNETLGISRVYAMFKPITESIPLLYCDKNARFFLDKTPSKAIATNKPKILVDAPALTP